MGEGFLVSEVMHIFFYSCCVLYTFLILLFTTVTVKYTNLFCFHVAPILRGLQKVRLFIRNLNLINSCINLRIPMNILMSDKFKVLSLNVRGLRERVKRKSVFAYLREQKCDVFFLQETYCQKEDAKIWCSEWGGKIFLTHGTTHSKGACILLKPNLGVSLDNEYSDSEGRVVLINARVNKQRLSLCNIYAPTEKDKENAFLEKFDYHAYW